ncbi:MAG TPA: hypothetical protein VGN57_11290 [Pirellulaceae bacterium]|jgi:probable HAF family extracellular repeat protein|nr:hypothetical protein [Pirellulaceae bacterium]
MLVRYLFSKAVATLALAASFSATHAQEWRVLPNILSIQQCSHDGRVATGRLNLGGGDFHAFRFTPDGGIEDLGVMPGGSKSGGMAMDADGSVIAGAADDGVNDRAFRWNQAGGTLLDMGTFGGPDATARFVSADGLTIVGEATVNAVDAHAFVWRADAGKIDLGTLGGAMSVAVQCSDDGQTVVGMAHDAGGIWKTFVWTDLTGMQDVGHFGGVLTIPNALSADGSTAIGGSLDGASQPRPFRWTETGGLENLGALGAGPGSARCVSADGSVICGYSMTASGARAFRWTEAEGMKSLGTFGGDESVPEAMSAKGDYIVGTAQKSDASHAAFLWRPQHGKKDLKWVIEQSLGIDLTGYRIDSCDALSRNGRRMYLTVERPDGTPRFYYVELAPKQRVAKDRWQAPYIAEHTNAALAYAQLANEYDPGSAASEYAYLYAQYGKTYGDAANKIKADYYDKKKKTNAYLSLRYSQYQMEYYAFVNAYYYGAQSGAPYAADTANAAHQAMTYLATEFE